MTSIFGPDQCAHVIRTPLGRSILTPLKVVAAETHWRGRAAAKRAVWEMQRIERREAAKLERV